MKHWKEYSPDEGPLLSTGFTCKNRLFQWIEQTRGKKSRSQFIRDILTEVMENG